MIEYAEFTVIFHTCVAFWIYKQLIKQMQCTRFRFQPVHCLQCISIDLKNFALRSGTAHSNWVQCDAMTQFEPSSLVMFEPSSSVMFELKSSVMFELKSSVMFQPSSSVMFEPSNSVMFEPSTSVMFEPSSSVMFDQSS